MTNESSQFRKLFGKWARRIRTRMTLRQALTGLAVGLIVGAIFAGIAWKTRQGSLRPYMAGAGAVGIVVGTVIAIRRKWTDTEVALYLDGRLEADEAITTAIQLGFEAEESEAAKAVVLTNAVKALETGNLKRVRPAVFGVFHVLIPVGAGALVLLSLIDVPALAVQPLEPGEELVHAANIEALDKVMELGRLDTPDPEQRERLKAIAEEAKKLKQKLAEGMERREAQSEIARLRDAVAAERARMSGSEQRSGLEAAHGRLAQEKALKEAAKALGDRDLTRFDEEMQKLANQREKQDREAAKKALEEAAEEAKKNGAKDVAKLLEEQKKLLEERSKRAEALRQFADAFGDAPEFKDQMEQFENEGLDEDASKLAERMADALKNLSPEERKRLADRLKEQLEGERGQGMDPMTKEQLEDLLEHLDSAEGLKQLEEMLRDMANEPPVSEEAERDRALGEAEKGLGEAEQGLGAPMPIPMKDPQGGSPGSGCDKPGCTKPGCKGDCDGKGGSSKGGENPGAQGGPGSHEDKGKGNHEGNTPKVQGDDFRARASAKINPGAPMPGVAVGRGQGQPGESANVRGIDGIGQAAPGEVGGVERSEIPEEYREHIGRYFSP